MCGRRARASALTRLGMIEWHTCAQRAVMKKREGNEYWAETTMPLHDERGGWHAAMAGKGDPYSVMRVEHLALLGRLHAGQTVAVSDDGLAPLHAASLLTIEEGRYHPAFFIADRAATARTDRHARALGAQLADALLARWATLERHYAALAISRTHTLTELAFLLVGDRILDVGLLDALAAEGELLPAAPPRPSPTNPEARYYFWLIAGEAAQLGRYGQRVTALPWPGWELATFGQYQLDGQPNTARESLEVRVQECLATAQGTTPAALAAAFALPLLDHDDTARWVEAERFAAAAPVAVYKANEAGLRALYASFRTSADTPTGFGEFFCWYDHLAYAHAIDALSEAGAMPLPAARFAAMLWHESTPGTF